MKRGFNMLEKYGIWLVFAAIALVSAFLTWIVYLVINPIFPLDDARVIWTIFVGVVVLIIYISFKILTRSNQKHLNQAKKKGFERQVDNVGKKKAKEMAKLQKNRLKLFYECEYILVYYLLSLKLPDLKVSSYWDEVQNTFFFYYNQKGFTDDEVVKENIDKIMNKYLFANGIHNFKFTHDDVLTNWSEIDLLKEIFDEDESFELADILS